MNEAVLVRIDLRAVGDKLARVGERRRIDKRVVRLVRDDDLDLDAGEQRDAQRLVDALVKDEVRRRDVI